MATAAHDSAAPTGSIFAMSVPAYLGDHDTTLVKAVAGAHRVVLASVLIGSG